MPLSTRYIVMINDALDAIPINEMADFELAATELKKIISSPEETLAFDPRFKDSMESIHEFFDPIYKYVKPHEQAEFCELLKKQIQIRIEKLRNFTEEQKQEKITERKEDGARRSGNQQKIAAFEPKRAEHERVITRDQNNFIEMQRLLFGAFSAPQGVLRDGEFNRVEREGVTQFYWMLSQQRMMLPQQTWRETISNLAANFAINFSAVGYAIIRGPHEERQVPQVQQPQQPLTRFEKARNAIIGIALLANMLQGFFAATSGSYHVTSIIPNVTLTNTTALAERFQENPFIFSAQLLLSAVMIAAYALLYMDAARHQVNNAQNFLVTTRDTIYGMWNQVRGGNHQVRHDVLDEIYDAPSDRPAINHEGNLVLR